MMDKHHGRPVVYLDADAYVWSRPHLFYEPMLCDIAVHYRQGKELLNGTLYLPPTPMTRAVVDRYAALVAARPDEHNEQRLLDEAIRTTPGMLVYRLPASYCWIHDLMADDLAPGEEPVIEHLQASRERFPTPHRERRRARLEEIGGA